MEVALTLAGLIGGLVLAVLWWQLTTHILVPRLAFSDAIAKDLEVEPGCAIYRFKVKNVGRRAIIDISVNARIVAPKYSIGRRRPGPNTAIDVPLDVEHLFILRPKSSRIVWLELENVEDILQNLGPSLAAAIEARRDGALKELLTIRDNIYLYVQALAYDQWSGARKYYTSKRYVASDIRRGKFSGLDVVDDAPPAEVPDDAGAEPPA